MSIDDAYEKMVAGLQEELEECVAACKKVRTTSVSHMKAFEKCLFSLQLSLAGMAARYVKAWPEMGITWFDHRFDWLRGPEWWAWHERGFAPMKHITSESRVLDLCSGDGFYAGAFYGRVAKIVHGLDRDKRAISHAKFYHMSDNVKFFHQDVFEEWPQLKYDVIVCMAAIEHFSATQADELLRKVSSALSEDGVFIGSTIITTDPNKHGRNPEHDREFRSELELHQFLGRQFGEIHTWTSQWGATRQDTYFECRR